MPRLVLKPTSCQDLGGREPNHKQAQRCHTPNYSDKLLTDSNSTSRQLTNSSGYTVYMVSSCNIPPLDRRLNGFKLGACRVRWLENWNRVLGYLNLACQTMYCKGITSYMFRLRHAGHSGVRAQAELLSM